MSYTHLTNQIDFTEVANDFREAHGYWASHPVHTLDQWQYEVSNGDTRQGYHQWLAGEMEIAHDDREVNA